MTVETRRYGAVVTNGDLNAGAVTSDWFVVDDWTQATPDIIVDNSGGVTAIALTFFHKRPGESDEFAIPLNDSAGTSAPLTLTWTVANGLKWSERVNVAGISEMKIVATPTGAGSGDTIDIDVWSTREC